MDEIAREQLCLPLPRKFEHRIEYGPSPIEGLMLHIMFRMSCEDRVRMAQAIMIPRAEEIIADCLALVKELTMGPEAKLVESVNYETKT